MYSSSVTTNGSTNHFSSEGKWEQITVKRKTTRNQRRIVRNVNSKADLSAYYSSESDNEGQERQLIHNTTLSRLSHYSETDDEGDVIPGEVRGRRYYQQRVWNFARNVADSTLVWIYWATVQAFVFEKWILNIRNRRAEESPVFVPVHRCQAASTSGALVRKGSFSPGKLSKTFQVPWTLFGLLLLLIACPAMLYFTDLPMPDFGGGFAAFRDMVSRRSHSHLKDPIIPPVLEDEELTTHRLYEEEQLGKIDERWRVQPLERREDISLLKNTLKPELSMEPISNIVTEQLKSKILGEIDRRLEAIEIKFQGELHRVEAKPPQNPPFSRSDLEANVIARVRQRLDELEALFLARVNTVPSKEQISSAIDEVIDLKIHQKVEAAQENLKVRLDEALDTNERVKPELMQQILSELKPELYAYTSNLVTTKDCSIECPPPAPEPVVVAGSGCDVDEKIRVAIAKYDADKTGIPDLALESGGGSIVSTRCTKKSTYMGSQLLIWNIPIWYPSNSPRKIIQPGTMPGDCWSFDGVEGFVVIKLVGPSRITGFTLEHLPKAISPHGQIESAPRRFQVVGHLDYTDFENEFLFGDYEYLDNGNPLQYFEVQNQNDTYFPYVELKILSNHGNVAFTCLYRFRVHGHIETQV